MVNATRDRDWTCSHEVSADIGLRIVDSCGDGYLCTPAEVNAVKDRLCN